MSTLVVGIGSPILGDDGVGIRVVRELEARGLPARVRVLELGLAGLTLLEHLEGCARLVLVDAMVSGAEPGTVMELRGDDVARAAHLGSSHEVDLPTALTLAKELLGRDGPREVVVVAVEAERLTEFSESLSPAVEEAVEEAVNVVQRLLRRTAQGAPMAGAV